MKAVTIKFDKPDTLEFTLNPVKCEKCPIFLQSYAMFGFKSSNYMNTDLKINSLVYSKGQ